MNCRGTPSGRERWRLSLTRFRLKPERRHARAALLKTLGNSLRQFLLARSQSNLVPLEFAVEGGAADPEHPARERLVPASLLKNAQNGGPLQVSQCRCRKV